MKPKFVATANLLGYVTQGKNEIHWLGLRPKLKHCKN